MTFRGFLVWLSAGVIGHFLSGIVTRFVRTLTDSYFIVAGDTADDRVLYALSMGFFRFVVLLIVVWLTARVYQASIRKSGK